MRNDKAIGSMSSQQGTIILLNGRLFEVAINERGAYDGVNTVVKAYNKEKIDP